MTNRRISSGRRTRSAPRRDNCRTALLNSRDEFFFIPGLFHLFDRYAAANQRMEQIGVLSGGMISPNRHLSHLVNSDAELLSELGHCSVVVQPSHSSKLARINIRCVTLSN